MEMMTAEFLWASLIIGGVVGIAILVKVPEFLVVLLLVGPDYIQVALRVVGLEVSRRQFATAGAVFFIPAVLVYMVLRMTEAGEHKSIIGQPNWPFLGMTILMGLWLVTGLTYTPASLYGGAKTGEYFIFGMTPMLLAFIFLRDEGSVRRLPIWVVCISGTSVILTTAYNLVTKGTIHGILTAGEDIGFETVVKSNIALGAAVVMLVAAVLSVAASRKKFIWRVLPLIVLPGGLFYVIKSGSRSSLVALLGVVTIGYTLTYRRNKGLLAVATLLTVLVIGLVYFNATEDVQRKIFSSWFDVETQSGRSGQSRIDILKEIPAMVVGAPVLGHGTGGWAFLTYGIDTYQYPHNMFAEMLVENGVIGLLVLLSLWYMVVHRLWRCMRIAEVGTELLGVVIFGTCLMMYETFNALAHFGLAHHSCGFLISAGIVLRSTFLVEEAAEPEDVGEAMLIRPILTSPVGGL